MENLFAIRHSLFALLSARLGEDRAELHGEAHVAGDAQLALHERRRAVEFALDHFSKSESATLIVQSAVLPSPSVTVFGVDLPSI